MSQESSHKTNHVALVFVIPIALLLLSATATEAASRGLVPLRVLSGPDDDPTVAFSFYVTSDIRGGVGDAELATCEYFQGVVEAIRGLDGGGALMVSPGDLDPLPATYHAITTTLGSDYHWYPGVGNHEFPGEGAEPYPGGSFDWLRAFDYDIGGTGVPPDLVSAGPTGCPSTTYSFDHGPAHFVMLNVYCDAGGGMATYGDIPDHLYAWLDADLAASTQPLTFVLGHEPAYPQRDSENGRISHAHNSLNEFVEHRDRFWALLAQHGVTAYFSGHTHSYNAVRIDNVWHISTGHAAGVGETETRSTFVRVLVNGRDVQYETYRQRPDELCSYELTDAWSSATDARDVVPTPVLTPTPPPRGMFPPADLPQVAAGLGLSLLTLALLLGTVLVIIIAVRAGRPAAERQAPDGE
ncbi:MAG: metallophosphoesterase [Anaerolineae bacterium]|nr:metallophosphoesterase [Anaerolineae bacterium]